MEQQVVGGDAGLPRIEGLAPCDAARGGLHVGASVHDAGAFAAQLQYDGREVPRRGGHDDPPQLGAAREEDEVPAPVQQQRIDVAVALDDGDVALVVDFADHRAERRRDVRRVGRGFQYGGAARRDGSDERVEQQLHGIVPRRDDERRAERLGEDAARRGKEFERRGPPLGAHPAAEVAEVVPHLAPHDAQLGEAGLLGGFAQVLPQGVA